MIADAPPLHSLWPRIGLGSAQWGQQYGIVNTAGRPSPDEVDAMLRLAAAKGVALLDTAHDYGESEAVIGRSAQSRSFRVVTKTPSLRTDRIGSAELERVRQALERSRSLLCRERLDAVLVHEANNLCVPGGSDLWQLLAAEKQRGTIGKVGVSVYNPTELQRIRDHFDIDLVQLPLSIYDQRFERQGLIEALTSDGIEVHARSVFLQGLLLTPARHLPKAFQSIFDHQQRFHDWAANLGLTPGHASIHYGLSTKVDGLILGCDTSAHVEQLLSNLADPIATEEWEQFALVDEQILEPFRWSR